MGDFDVDFFLETLKQLIMSSNVESIIKEKHQLESLEEEIKYVRGFLRVTEKKRNENSKVMNLMRQIKDMISEAEDIIELFVVQAFKANQNQDCLSLDLESVKKKIKTLAAECYSVLSQQRSRKLSAINICTLISQSGKLLRAALCCVTPRPNAEAEHMANVVGMLEGGYPVVAQRVESLSFLPFFGRRRTEVPRIEAHNVQNGWVLFPQANASSNSSSCGPHKCFSCMLS
ncbi:hypothetical protein RHMOL_Rhmol02G0081100 [Rhododendron molle]|uniref:Uncharacterized protein n=1 Tax=Rhododendron molle TaxID=49168 RepID=A0ACC0PN54_RHOML|nr:hypothetical protein RHMOL_Rhmol02G0081100 [Rhododendron molle]